MTTSLVDGSPRTLGPFTVGPLAFGCWRFITQPVGQAQALLEAALAAGMNLVDTADVYGLDWEGTGFGSNEAMLGKVLAEAPTLRDQMVLATKGGISPPTPYDSSADYLTEACEASLDRLGVDVIDLYQIHRPDFYTHPEEVADTLTALRVAGKIREVGVSNHQTSQTAALQAYLDFPIISDQPEFSLHALDALRDGTLDACMQYNRVALAWSPLAGGSLATGEGVSPELLAVMDELAGREQVARAVLAVAFVLAHPSKPVAIIGSQTADRLVEQATAVNVSLDRHDVYRLIQASEGRPLP